MGVIINHDKKNRNLKLHSSWMNFLFTSHTLPPVGGLADGNLLLLNCVHKAQRWQRAYDEIRRIRLHAVDICDIVEKIS